MKKIIYKFSRNQANNPRFTTNIDYEMLWELGSIESKYIREIVAALDEIKSGERESFHFGMESTHIECYGDGDKDYSNKTFINYDWGEQKMEIPFDEIYNLMKDWRDYLDEWEKETGKEKK